MKISTTFALILASLIAVFSLTTQSCDGNQRNPNDKEPPCNLPEPSLAFVSGIDSTSVKLNWSLVDSAQGYKIIVTDSASGNLEIDTTLGNQFSFFIINNLSPGTTYKVELSAVCSNGSPSENTFQKFFKPPINLIIGDAVVMLNGPNSSEPGLSDCHCNDASEWSAAPVPVDWVREFTSERRVIEFELSQGSQSKTFKIAFNRNCTTIKVLDCTVGTGSINPRPREFDNRIEPIRITINDSASSPFIEIRSYSEGGGERIVSITYSNPSCMGCNVKIRECGQTTGWDGSCG